MSTDPHEPDEEELEERLRKLLGEAEEGDESKLDDIELQLRDVEQKLESSQGDRQGKEALFDAEFEDRLQKLHDRAESMKSKRDAVEAERTRHTVAEQASARGLGVGLSVAYAIIGLPLLCAGIGWLIDRSAGGNTGKALGAVIGLAIGIVVAIRLLGHEEK